MALRERFPMPEEKTSSHKPAPPPAREMTAVEAISQLAENLKPQGPLQQAGFSQAQIDQLTKIPAPKKYRGVVCKSDRTGACFVAHVVESKKFPHGRIVALHEYTHPDGIFEYVSNGGLVPDGFPILKDANGGALGPGIKLEKHQLSALYLQWRWTEFWQRDLEAHVGKGLAAHHCADADGLRTPWLEGAVRSLIDDSDEG